MIEPEHDLDEPSPTDIRKREAPGNAPSAIRLSTLSALLASALAIGAALATTGGWVWSSSTRAATTKINAEATMKNEAAIKELKAESKAVAIEMAEIKVVLKMHGQQLERIETAVTAN